jgi:hypothetical protein
MKLNLSASLPKWHKQFRLWSLIQRANSSVDWRTLLRPRLGKFTAFNAQYVIEMSYQKNRPHKEGRVRIKINLARLKLSALSTLGPGERVSIVFQQLTLIMG